MKNLVAERGFLKSLTPNNDQLHVLVERGTDHTSRPWTGREEKRQPERVRPESKRVKEQFE